MVLLRDVVAVLDELYDPRWADDWDAVGTVVGEPAADIRKVMFAVDPVRAVVDEAVAWGADLLVTHHPLYLKGVTSVAASTPKGAVVHALITNGLALHTCHTNADSPPGGVSDSLARTLGLTAIRPLEPDPALPLDKWVVFVPDSEAASVSRALTEAGGGAGGHYDQVTFAGHGTGTFRPLPGAQPALGSVGRLEIVAESRVELVAPRSLRADLTAALRAAHPYEEPAFDVIELASQDSTRGSGRIGRLPEPMTLRELAGLVTARLPRHHSSTRVAGDPDRVVQTVALCGGSGDFLLAQARNSGADVYLTSDLRHHPVSEHLENSDAPAIIDVPHWAAEWTWLPVGAAALTEALRRRGDTVETRVSTTVTDPWTFHLDTSRIAT